MYLWEHLPAKTYSIGPVCMIGDAAHSTTPWQSSGVGMSIEDALILSSVLGRSKSQSEAKVALQVYDQTRRARTQRVVESSNGTGMIFTGTKADFDLYDIKQMKQHLKPRWDFIRFIDLTKDRDDAIELFKREVEKL